jgi:tetratricopeptide (TPR) repeat protein
MVAAPDVRFVVTSRVALGIGEESIELGALPLPRPGSAGGDAVDLFVDRVRTHRGTYAPEDDELSTIAEIVGHLGGVPLAIELAAARMNDEGTLEPMHDLLARISRRSMPPVAIESVTQRAIDRAFALLPEAEREALCQASVFRGSFTLHAASHVVRIPGVTRVSDVVTTLARKSLLQVERHDPLRFSMSESIRSYAADTLAQSLDASAVAWRHAQLYFERAAEIAGLGPHAGSSPPADAADDRDDLQAAMALGASAGHSQIVLRIALALDAISLGSGLGGAELAHLDDALRAGAAHELGLLGRALGVRAAALYSLGRLDEARRDAEMALRLATELSDRRQMGAMSRTAGEASFQLGEFPRAIEHLDRALEIARERDDASAVSGVHYLLGSLHQSAGDKERARLEFESSLAIALRAGDGASEARAQMGLAWEQLDRGDHAAARQRYERALDLAQPLGMARTERIVTGYLGVLHFDAGELDLAEVHLRRAAFESKRAGDFRVEGIFEGIRGGVLATLDRLAESRRSFALADELLAGNAFYASAIAVHRGHLDLAEARLASKRADLGAVLSHVAAARRRIADARAEGAGGDSIVSRSDDARLAVRILERAVAAF